jgi:predicted RND superfamily exporter protein
MKVGYPDSIGLNSFRLYGGSDLERTESDGAWRSQYVLTSLTIMQNPDGVPSGSVNSYGTLWIDYFEPMTMDPKKKYTRRTDKVKVQASGGSHTQFIYVSDDLSMTQLMNMLFDDVLLAAVALGSIAVYVFIHSGSLFLTFMGLMNVILAFPVGFWVYTGLFNVDALPILTPVTLIVCIGIAVDDVFVFVDTFKQTNMEGNLDSRMAHMFSSCVSATSFTTLSSVSAFAANTVSDVAALSNFVRFFPPLFFMLRHSPSRFCFGRGCSAIYAVSDSTSDDFGDNPVQFSSVQRFCFGRGCTAMQ